jgi:hypothetical protein
VKRRPAVLAALAPTSTLAPSATVAAAPPAAPAPTAPYPSTVKDGSSDEEDYEVGDILDVRRRRGVEQFLIRWKGCAPQAFSL